jgi:hypothetical protein
VAAAGRLAQVGFAAHFPRASIARADIDRHAGSTRSARAVRVSRRSALPGAVAPSAPTMRCFTNLEPSNRTDSSRTTVFGSFRTRVAPGAALAIVGKATRKWRSHGLPGARVRIVRGCRVSPSGPKRQRRCRASASVPGRQRRCRASASVPGRQRRCRASASVPGRQRRCRASAAVRGLRAREHGPRCTAATLSMSDSVSARRAGGTGAASPSRYTTEISGRRGDDGRSRASLRRSASWP